PRCGRAVAFQDVAYYHRPSYPDGVLYLPYVLFGVHEQGYRLRMLWRCDQADALAIVLQGYYPDGFCTAPVLAPAKVRSRPLRQNGIDCSRGGVSDMSGYRSLCVAAPPFYRL